MEFGWEDIDDIAIGLYDKYPEQKPLDIRFTDLLDYILALDGFNGKRESSNEAKLETVQMAWYEEWQDNQ